MKSYLARRNPAGGILVRVLFLSLIALTFLTCSDDTGTNPIDPIDWSEYTVTTLRDYHYLPRTYFDVGKFGADSLGIAFEPGQDTIIDIGVYVPGSRDAPEDYFALMYIDPRVPDAYPKNVLYGFMHRLEEGVDYVVNREDFWIRFLHQPPSNQVIACYLLVGTRDGRVKIGEIDPGPEDPYTLKMLRAERAYAGSPTWNYEWHNVYDLGVGECPEFCVSDRFTCFRFFLQRQC